MDLYRAEARRTHNGHGSVWTGKWRKDRHRAVAQAMRWRTSNPFAAISVVCTNGMTASLEELEAAQGRNHDDQSSPAAT